MVCFYELKATKLFSNRLEIKVLIMKNLLLGIAFAMGTFLCSAQATNSQSNTSAFFAQCMVDLNNESELTALENQLRAIPYVSIVRVDLPSHRLFLTTKDIQSFTVTEFASWMGAYASSYSCLQIGLHGVDPVKPYPFTNCQD
ncbi:hypothetical protein D3C87_796570 [compost metagenome]